MVAITRPLKQFAKYFVRDWMDRGIASLDGINILTDENLIGREARRLILLETYEKPERNIVKQAISSDDRVLEFGGCLGLLSLLCARIVGSANVLCYEPNPIACQIIKRNYDLNTLYPELREKALTANGGQVEFFQTENLFSSSIYERSTPGNRISVPSDCFAEVVMGWKPTVLVVDAEGAECELLPSSELQSVRAIILETHEKIVGRKKNEDLLSHLQNTGFTIQTSLHGRMHFVRQHDYRPAHQ